MIFEKNELKINNSLTGKKEVFKPINKDFIGLYVCGPTVYSQVHLGNCRTFISFDMIYRYFLHLGYKVRFVRNITDVGHLENDADEGEDKIAKKARMEQLEPMEVVQHYTIDFHKVLSQFNNKPPNIEPTATGHIIEQIEMIKEIMDNGFAYEVNGSVYFDVEKYNNDHNYGILSKRKIEDLISGTRTLDGQSEKRSLLDFALWKKGKPEHIMKWPSPWGLGFPGWHLECSAMSTKYLGERFDIHGGGMDLKFPHHDCEIAQGTAANKKHPVNYWMHANMLTLNGKKMSKSTGNTLLPEALFSGNNAVIGRPFHPIVVRFFMMQAHYASVLDFSADALNAAEKGFNRLMEGINDLKEIVPSATSSVDVQGRIQKFYDAMNDDFNTPVLIAHLFDAIKQIQMVKRGQETLSHPDIDSLSQALHAFTFDVLGLKEIGASNENNKSLETVMELVLQMRQKARAQKDWATADAIRDKLEEANIVVKDSKEGATWKIQ